MRTRTLALFVAIAAFPALCQAPKSCLWLNAATAGGVLGGPVTATVTQAKTNPSVAHPANAISSAGPLSADASGEDYSGNGMDDSDCTFIRQAGTTDGELRIKVRTMRDPVKDFASYSAKCGRHAIPLKAIGNEAVTCSLTHKSGHPSEQVVGRVRDRAFVIRISMTDSSMTQELLHEKARAVAEHVAGNLF